MENANSIEDMEEINLNLNSNVQTSIDLKDYEIKDKIKAIAKREGLTTPEQIEKYLEGVIDAVLESYCRKKQINNARPNRRLYRRSYLWRRNRRRFKTRRIGHYTRWICNNTK